MLEPIRIKFFFLIILLIDSFASLVHLVILPLVNLPDDFPWPEYSIARKPNFF